MSGCASYSIWCNSRGGRTCRCHRSKGGLNMCLVSCRNSKSHCCYLLLASALPIIILSACCSLIAPSPPTTGDRIVFASYHPSGLVDWGPDSMFFSHGKWEIYVMNADGSHLTRLSDGDGYVIELLDGRRGWCSLKKRVNRAVHGIPPLYHYHFRGHGMLK